MKKIHSTVIHHGINLQGSFWSVDEQRTGHFHSYNVGMISFDGWMYIMGQVFSGLFSFHEISELFESFDDDKDQIIDYSPFLKDLFERPDIFLMIRQKLINIITQRNQSVDTFFKELDEDNDAFLDIMEFEVSVQKIFPSIDHDDMIEVFDRFDLNRSGQISIEEFKTAICDYDKQTKSYQSM